MRGVGAGLALVANEGELLAQVRDAAELREARGQLLHNYSGNIDALEQLAELGELGEANDPAQHTNKASVEPSKDAWEFESLSTAQSD